MTIIYIPTKESFDIEVTRISDVIKITDTINPIEQNQYKTFEFCNMTEKEEYIIRRKYLHGIAMDSGVSIESVDKNLNNDNIYIPEIGRILMR